MPIASLANISKYYIDRTTPGSVSTNPGNVANPESFGGGVYEGLSSGTGHVLDHD